MAWSRGTPGEALKAYLRLLSNEGGHLVAAVAVAGAAAGALSAVAYLLVLSLPASTWALNAADSYAHYATLPVGLILLAALIELGERSLPLANLAGPRRTSCSPERSGLLVGDRVGIADHSIKRQIDSRWLAALWSSRPGSLDTKAGWGL